MRVLVFCLCLAGVSASAIGSALPTQQRIVGGNETSIERYPSAVVILMYNCFTHTYRQECGGVIINKNLVLTSGHCIRLYVPAYYFDLRVGSTYAYKGGAVHYGKSLIVHEDFNERTNENDIGIIRSATDFEFSSLVAPGNIARKGYPLGDNEPVWATGWGVSDLTDGSGSDTLQEVMFYTVNWEECKKRYEEIRQVLYPNMFCAAVLGDGSKSQCAGDTGSPLYHNNAVVGLGSWGDGCDSDRYPGVNVLVSAYDDWISSKISTDNTTLIAS